jgi:hypothetical protein
VKEPRAHRGLIGAVLLALFATALPRASYLDPGTGSYVFQVVVGTILGVGVAVKMTWRRMWAFMSRKPKVRQEEDD